MSDDKRKLADSGDRLSTRASVFALLLLKARNEMEGVRDEMGVCWCCLERIDKGHTADCLISLVDRALDADTAELDAIRTQLTGGDA